MEKSLSLLDYVTEISTINCDDCKTFDSHEGAALDDALDIFYGIGWRVNNGKCLCPNCIKKIK